MTPALRQPVDATAASLMLLLCFCWGFNYVVAKLTAPGVSLVALFSPEHGIRGVLDEDVPSSKDETTGLPIHSLSAHQASDRRDARHRRDGDRSSGHRAPLPPT
jgi:hypothetical protein